MTLHLIAGRPVTGGCLVGAIVHAAGGPSTAHGQPVQRALDLTWHTLYRTDQPTIDWCPAPAVRAARVRDLTLGNDHPGRSSHEVTTLLRMTEQRATAATAQIRGVVTINHGRRGGDRGRRATVAT